MSKPDDVSADVIAKNGLVRQPVEYAVALMVATGLPAEAASQLWLMDRAGQLPLYPPNVSGWRPNGYWVNASALEARNRMAQGIQWELTRETWYVDNGVGYFDLPGGRITRDHMDDDTSAAFVDRLIAGLQMPVPAATRATTIAHLDDPAIRTWQRLDALLLLLLAPFMHIA